jgi:hypothetical protein
MKNYYYAIGFVRGRTTKYLATRETNLRRAKKTLRDLLKGNTKYKKGVVAYVKLNREGEEVGIRDIYEAETQ